MVLVEHYKRVIANLEKQIADPKTSEEERIMLEQELAYKQMMLSKINMI